MNEQLKFNISGSIKNMQEKQFNVSPGIKKLTLEYDIAEKEKMLVVLILRDSRGKIRFQKQISHSSEPFCITDSPRTSTIGAVPGPIHSGVWSISVSVNIPYAQQILKEATTTFSISISDKDVDIKETIGDVVWVDDDLNYKYYDFDKVYNKDKRWYKGDFHAHTRLSDGIELIPEINRKAHLMDMDFYTFTEHNLIHTGWSNTDLLILPSMEYTSPLGHSNVFGMKKRLSSTDSLLSSSDLQDVIKSMDEYIKECKENSLLLSINHPFLYIWSWLYEEISLEDISCIEIVNDPTYEANPDADAHGANNKSIMLADKMVEDGYNIVAIGGSDSHMSLEKFYKGANSPSIAGDPSTLVFCNGLTANNVVEGLKNRNVFVTRHCDVYSSIFECDNNCIFENEVRFGDILSKNTVKVKYDISIITNKTPIIYYIFNGNKIFLKEMDVEEVDNVENGYFKIVDHIQGSTLKKYNVKGEIRLENIDYNWIRFGATTEEDEFLFYGNALFKGSKKHKYKKYGEIIKYIK